MYIEVLESRTHYSVAHPVHPSVAPAPVTRPVHLSPHTRVQGPSPLLLNALALHESNGNPNAVGDNGQAVGILQIHPILVDDVNRILKSPVYSYDDRLDMDKSYRMCEIYLTYYGQHYLLNTGQLPDDEVYARMWVGGPRGYLKDSTLPYWQAVSPLVNGQ